MKNTHTYLTATLALLTAGFIHAAEPAATNFHSWALHRWAGTVGTASADSKDKYLAVFNTRDAAKDAPKGSTAAVAVKLTDLGFTGSVRIRDLWEKKELAPVTADFAPEVSCHGARLFRLRPAP